MLLSQTIKEVYMKSLLLIFSLSFLSSVVVADPIHDAAVVGNLQEVQRLINEGVSVDSKC